MDKDLDNANPTILSAAQLPTRQNKRSAPKSGPEHMFDEVIFAKPWYLSQPFCDDDSLWPDADAELDKWAPEPIDEQEIYGEASLFPSILRPIASSLLSAKTGESDALA
ncbi:FAM96B-like protein [Colletotrichum tofieldiae]|nr:FAM96B-like protein [Colletotrichum tofieldiae]